MKTLMTLMTALFAAAMFTGCTYTPGYAKADPLSDDRYPQVTTFGWLANDFYVDNAVVKKEEDTGKPMSVTIEVRRLEPAWNRELPCQYRFIFLDRDGVALDPDPAWNYRSIEPKVKTILQGSAPDIGAVDWRAEIRKERAERRRSLWNWY